MKKYFYFVTSADVWFDQAVKLYEEAIAEPVLWLGDGRHQGKAQSAFQNCYVADMNDVIHYPWRLENTQYESEFSDFFHSENYIRCKDICLKLMDRLDHVGMFTRLDREIYLKNISFWALSKIAETKPDALIMAEAPHSHGQYLIYEIFLYLNIPTAQFITWTIQPIVMLQRVQENDLLNCKMSFNLPEWKEMNHEIDQYIEKIVQSNNYEDFIPKELLNQKKATGWFNTLFGDIANVTFDKLPLEVQQADSFKNFGIKNFFSKSMLKVIGRETYRNWKFIFNKEYLPVNPQFLGFFSSLRIKRSKRKKMMIEHNKNFEKCDLSQSYVYFALHYEPERSTTPDGGEFHDQLLAIIEIRKILPDNIYIYVKEHPSQFYLIKGARGRSPIFYDSLRRIQGVKLIDTFTDSSALIKNSLFIGAITGTTTMEASILGKKTVYFGNAWFSGIPNAIRWHDKLTLEDIMSLPVAKPTDIYNFLIDLKSNHGIPCYRNKGHVGNAISDKNKTKAFAEAEIKGVVHLIVEFFKSLDNKRT